MVSSMIQWVNRFSLALAPLLLTNACGCHSSPPGDVKTTYTLSAEVDSLVAQVSRNTSGTRMIVTIDHSRLAKAEGVDMPPSVVTMFSEDAVNTTLVQANPLLGLDLPHRILVYAEPGARTPSVAFANSDYLMQRYGISEGTLFSGYQESLDRALAGIPDDLKLPVTVADLNEGYGLLELVSDFSFGATIERLRKVVMLQQDTKWFGEVDFKADAAKLGVDLPEATLLLFGGPKPGGRAMAEYPRLGLDAFCQKVLVYEDSASNVRVAFNDIVAFAELHYGQSSPIQQTINSRLRETFARAISQSD